MSSCDDDCASKSNGNVAQRPPHDQLGNIPKKRKFEEIEITASNEMKSLASKQSSVGFTHENPLGWKTRSEMLDIAKRAQGTFTQYQVRIQSNQTVVKDQNRNSEKSIGMYDLVVQSRFISKDGNTGGQTFLFLDWKLPGTFKNKNCTSRTIFHDTRPLLYDPERSDIDNPTIFLSPMLDEYDARMIKKFIVEAKPGVRPREFYMHTANDWLKRTRQSRMCSLNTRRSASGNHNLNVAMVVEASGNPRSVVNDHSKEASKDVDDRSARARLLNGACSVLGGDTPAKVRYSDDVSFFLGVSIRDHEALVGIHSSNESSPVKTITDEECPDKTSVTRKVLASHGTSTSGKVNVTQFSDLGREPRAVSGIVAPEQNKTNFTGNVANDILTRKTPKIDPRNWSTAFAAAAGKTDSFGSKELSASRVIKGSDERSFAMKGNGISRHSRRSHCKSHFCLRLLPLEILLLWLLLWLLPVE